MLQAAEKLFKKVSKTSLFLIQEMEDYARLFYWASMVAQRAVYLCFLRKNNSGNKRELWFSIDETWFHIHYAVHRCWKDKNTCIRGVHQLQCQKRNGVHTHALQMYNAKSKSSDHQSEMDTINFTKCDKKSINIRTTKKVKCCSRQWSLPQ